MRTWHLASGNPLSLEIACDARLTRPDYPNDQIWELRLASGEPPAISVETTFGLRAKQMRLFPRFCEEGTWQADPAKFTEPAFVYRFFPNYIAVGCSPFPGIDVTIEYWVPESHVLAGRVQLSNTGDALRQLDMEWVAVLLPVVKGEAMAAWEQVVSPVLKGQVEDLSPVFFITGGPTAGTGPFASLILQSQLAPGEKRVNTWALASAGDAPASLELARQTTARAWDAELARIEVLDQGSFIEITSDNPEWDTAFALSQRSARTLVINPWVAKTGTEYPPGVNKLETRVSAWEKEPQKPVRRRETKYEQAVNDKDNRPEQGVISLLKKPGLGIDPAGDNPAFALVAARRPDFGFSPRGDGSDYQHLWNGQTAQALHYLTTQALPLDVSFRQHLLEFFITSARDGSLDLRPGPAGQRSHLLAQPWLCQLASACLEQGSSPGWLKKIYPALIKFLQEWFEPGRVDGSKGLPVWEHLQQMGFEDHPIFSRAEHGGTGLDITTVHDPTLFSELWLECKALIQLAEATGNPGDVQWLGEKANILEAAIRQCWDNEAGIFLPCDRDTGCVSRGGELGRFFGSGTISIAEIPSPPIRLLVNLKAATENTRNPRLAFRGSYLGDPIEEEITARSVYWVHNQAWITSQHAFTSLEQVEVRGLDPRDEVIVQSANLTSPSLASFLPLMAGICSPEQVQRMVSNYLTDPRKFCLPFGMPASPPHLEEGYPPRRVPVPWNTYTIAGLHRAGFTREASGLFTYLMAGILVGLKVENRFRANRTATNGGPGGDAGCLEGLAPLGLFLELSGIRILSPWRIILSEKRTFTGPLTVKYQGTMIERTVDEARVTFPDGQTIVAIPKGDLVVSLTKQEML